MTDHVCCKCPCHQPRYCQCADQRLGPPPSEGPWYCGRCNLEIHPNRLAPAPDPGVLVREMDLVWIANQVDSWPKARVVGVHPDHPNHLVLVPMPGYGGDSSVRHISDITFNGRPVRGFQGGWSDEDMYDMFRAGVQYMSALPHEDVKQLSMSPTLTRLKAQRDQEAGRT